MLLLAGSEIFQPLIVRLYILICNEFFCFFCFSFRARRKVDMSLFCFCVFCGLVKRYGIRFRGTLCAMQQSAQEQKADRSIGAIHALWLMTCARDKVLNLAQPGYPPEGASPAGFLRRLISVFLRVFKEIVNYPEGFGYIFIGGVTTLCHSLRKKTVIRAKRCSGCGPERAFDNFLDLTLTAL